MAYRGKEFRQRVPIPSNYLYLNNHMLLRSHTGVSAFSRHVTTRMEMRVPWLSQGLWSHLPLLSVLWNWTSKRKRWSLHWNFIDLRYRLWWVGPFTKLWVFQNVVLVNSQTVKEILECSTYLVKMVQIQWKVTALDDKAISEVAPQKVLMVNTDLPIYLRKRHRCRKILGNEAA